MRKDIKGITIQLEAETTALGKAFKDVEQQSRGINKELNEINKLLKFNPKDPELLAQKQKLLGDQVDKTREKLNGLKEAEKQVQEQFKKGEISEEQYRSFRREIVETESKLKHYEGQLQELNKTYSKLGQGLQDAGDKIKATGDKMTEFGTSMTKKVTGPIAALSAASAVAWKEVDDSLDGIVKATGATGDELKNLHGVWENVVSTMPVDLDATSDAVGELNTQFGTFGDELEEQTRQTVKFAEITGQDVVGAVQGAKKAMELFGLETEDYARVLDVVAKAGQDTGVSVDQIWEAVRRGAPSLKAMGLGLEESVVLLSEMEKNGLESQKAIGYLGRAQATLAKDGKTLNQGLDEFNKIVNSGASETEQLAAASELFGTRGAVFMLEAAKQGVLDLGEMADAVGTVSDTFEATLDPIDEYKTAMNNAKLAGAELFSAIQTAAAPILEELSSFLRGVTTRFKEMSPETQQLIIKIGGLVAAVGPLLAIGGKLVSKVGDIASGVGRLVTSIGDKGGLMGALTSMSPAMTTFAGLALAAAAALGVMAIDANSTQGQIRAMVKENEKARAEFKRTTDGIKDQGEKTKILVDRLYELERKTKRTADEQAEMEGILKDLNQQYPDLNLAIDEQTGLLNKSKIAVDDYIDAWIRSKLIEAYSDQIVDAYKRREEAAKLVEKAEQATAKELERLATVQSAAMENVSSDFKKSEETAKKALQAIDDEIDEYKNKIRDMSDDTRKHTGIVEDSHRRMTGSVVASTEAQKDALDEISEQYEEEVDRFAEYRRKVEQGTEQHLSAMGRFSKKKLDLAEATTKDYIKHLNEETDAFLNYHSNLNKIAAKVGPDVADHLRKLGPEAAPLIAKFVNASEEELKELTTAVRRQMSAAEAEAKRGATGLGDAGKQAALDYLRGVIEGLKNKTLRGNIKKEAGDVGTQITKSTKYTLMSKSPSKVGIDIGENYTESIGMGIRNAMKKAGQAASDMAGELIDKTKLDADQLRISPAQMASRTALSQISNTAMNSGDIVIKEMIVRDDNDIRLIARELHTLQQSQLRGRGIA